MANIRDIMNDNVNGATFISITTSTDPRLTGGKKNPHKGKVRKVQVGSNVMVFQNKNTNAYENMVKRRLEKEGKNPASFVLSDRAWGHRLQGSPFVEHNGEYYLEVIFLHAGDVHYELDGNTIAAADVIGLPAQSENGHQGGLSDKVVIRTFKIDSITEITINGETYDDLEYI